MEFYLDIEKLEDIISQYDKVIKLLESQQGNFNNSLENLMQEGWQGKVSDAFKNKHDETNQKFNSFREEVEKLRNTLENEIKPKVDDLKAKSDALPTSFSGQDASMSGSKILYLNYSSISRIKSIITYEFYDIGSLMNDGMNIISDMCEELKTNSLSVTMSNTIESCKKAVNDNISSLSNFSKAFDEYKKGVEELEITACESFSKISGIEINFSELEIDTSFVNERGIPRSSVLREILEKQRKGEDLSLEEEAMLKYLEGLIGKSKYQELKEKIENASSDLEKAVIVSKYVKEAINDIEFTCEKIVVSGDHAEGYAPQNFIETAIKQMKEWKKNSKPGDKITWMVVKTGYSDADIKAIEEAAKKYGVDLKYIDSINNLTQHINDGYDRDKVKITDCTFFSHGLRNEGGTLALDYGNEQKSGNEANDINISSQELLNSGINRNAFSNVHTYFGACNLGTVTDMGNGTGKETSFMDSWISVAGGIAEGVTDPTPYSVPGAEGKDIGNAGGQSDFNNIRGKLATNLAGGKRVFSSIFGMDITTINTNGCDNYIDINKEEPAKDRLTNEIIYDKNGEKVSKNNDVYWERVYEDGTKERIEQGGPRK